MLSQFLRVGPNKQQGSSNLLVPTVSTTSVSSQPRRMGDLGDGTNMNEQLHELKGRVEKTMNKNKNELQNYRELSKFNEQLSRSYVANLKIIVDISKLLNGYNEFFDMFKSKLAEIDQELAIPISSDDFDYMRRLTTEQLVQLNDTFKKETGNLKRLYSRYGRQREFNDVDVAEKLFDRTKTMGDTTYAAIKPSTGGKKRTNKKRNKNDINKK
jgi:hypothetical protein